MIDHRHITSFKATDYKVSKDFFTGIGSCSTLRTSLYVVTAVEPQDGLYIAQ
jgi:hypothetical protein